MDGTHHDRTDGARAPHDGAAECCRICGDSADSGLRRRSSFVNFRDCARVWADRNRLHGRASAAEGVVHGIVGVLTAKPVRRERRVAAAERHGRGGEQSVAATDRSAEKAVGHVLLPDQPFVC